MTDKPVRLPRAATPEAKLAKLTAVGEDIAARLRADPDMAQEHAAVLAGISRRSYWDYLEGEDEACLAFQAIVLPAVFEQAQENWKKAEQDIGSTESGSGAWASWHKWGLEKRYRKIYGDLAQQVKVELTGKDGGAIAVTARPPTRAEALQELRQLAAGDPEVRALLAANAGEDGEDA